MRPLIGYEGLYSVTKDGRVFSHFKDKFLTPKNRGEYHAVSLYKDGSRKNHSIHRLVAETFLENPNHYPEVNHIDEDKHNNHVDNLEWCSISDNQSHSKSKFLYTLRKGEEVLEVINVREACREHNFPKGSFWRVRKGLQTTVHGWEVTYQTLDRR